MAIWLGIIVFITYFNTYETDTNTCGKKFGRYWKKIFEKMIKNDKNVKKLSKMAKNGGKMSKWRGIIEFITYHIKYETITNTCGKTFGRNWNLKFEKMSKKWWNCPKMVKNIGKMPIR